MMTTARIAVENGSFNPIRQVAPTRILFNTWFLWTTQIKRWKETWIGSAVFAGITVVTNRHTNSQTTLCHEGQRGFCSAEFCHCQRLWPQYIMS